MYIRDNSEAFQTEKSTEAPVTMYKRDGMMLQRHSMVITEHTVEVFVNDRLAMRLVCTPSYLKELIVGRCITAGYIKSPTDIEQLYICESGHTAKVFLKESCTEFLSEEIGIEPSCCTANQVFLKQEAVLLRHLESTEWEPEWVFELTEAFREDSVLHRTTQGTHSAYLAMAGKVLFSAEDIGRHNALDKVVGYMYLHDLAPEKCMLFTTGRLPRDMVIKAAAARIPLLISKAVPTAEGITAAKQYGVTLICRAWPDSFEVF